MLPEVLEHLNVVQGGRFVDATCGEGGHSEGILNATQVGGVVLGIDTDFEAVEVATTRLADFGENFICVNANFRNIRKIAASNGFIPVHGILFDLGLSSLQLDIEQRGFSFKRSDPLDMRFGVEQKLTAADIVNGYSHRELASVIRAFGEEPQAAHIAQKIIENRPLTTSLELAEVVRKAARPRNFRTHPATRTFQALRIAVNQELTSLAEALTQAVQMMTLGSRIVVLSYHSLEDRIVKHFFREQATDCICPPKLPECVCTHKATLKIITRSPIAPTSAEVKFNPRSRSAKLRCAERI